MGAKLTEQGRITKTYEIYMDAMAISPKFAQVTEKLESMNLQSAIEKMEGRFEEKIIMDLLVSIC